MQYACGGGEMLVENGVPATDFKLDTAEKFRARTAAGLKTDGTLILYTVDESDISAGLTLPLLAERMSKLGCVTAINFAKLFQLDTPVLHAMTGLSNIMMKTDYYQQGYTMKVLGLDGMSPAEMVAYMRTGETR